MKHSQDPRKSTAGEPEQSARKNNNSKAAAWLTVGWLAPDGTKGDAEVSGAIPLAVVNVHEEEPSDIEHRLKIMRAVRHQCPHAVLEAQSAIFVWPAGVLSAAAEYLPSRQDSQPSCDGLRILREIAAAHPANATIIFGADRESGDQYGYIIQKSDLVRVILRAHTPLLERIFEVENVKGLVAICGEGTGSYSENNGPFNDAEVLSDPVRRLGELGAQLLIIPSHRRVRGTVGGSSTQRHSHQRQAERFAEHGGAVVLSHHHGGELVNGRPKDDCADDWIIFKGGDWLNEDVLVPGQAIYVDAID